MGNILHHKSLPGKTVGLILEKKQDGYHNCFFENNQPFWYCGWFLNMGAQTLCVCIAPIASRNGAR